GALGRPGHLGQGAAPSPDLVVVDIEFAGQQVKEALAPGRIERQKGAAEIGRASARGNLTAAPVEAAENLLAQPAGVVAGQVEPGGTGQNPARGLGDLAPSAAQIGQRPVEDAFEKAGGSAV